MKRTPLTRRTPLRRSNTLRSDPRAWQERSRTAARLRPGRASRSTLRAVTLRAVTLRAVGHRGEDDRAAASKVRPVVWARDRGACQFPHHLQVMAAWPCSAPRRDQPPLPGDETRYHPSRPLGWRPDPRNRGALVLCHVIPRELAGALKWDPDNLFVGCDRGNAMAEEATGPAFETLRHGHPWDRVEGGQVVAPEEGKDPDRVR